MKGTHHLKYTFCGNIDVKDQAVSAVSIEVTSPLSLDIRTAAVLRIGPVHSVPQA